MSNFVPPEFWSFPPFFTIQPVLPTCEKQLKLWRDLIIGYCIQGNLYHLVPSTFPYFKNESIDRQLSKEGINSVVESLIKAGNAEWEDNLKTSLRIIWKTPEALSGEIYDWARKSALLGQVFTIYELHSGDDEDGHTDSGFHGTDPLILRRALAILEKVGKCVLIEGSIPEEDGVKFI